MREVISLHLGQAGIQTGTTCWELSCLEHGLDPTGTLVVKGKDGGSQTSVEGMTTGTPSGSDASMSKSRTNGEPSEEEIDGAGEISSFFEEMSAGNYAPRAMLIDLEPTVVDQVRNGKYRGLYCPKQLLSGKEDAANNYARGYCTVGRTMIGPVMNQLRKMIESCHTTQGFMLYHSFGGGTGSGFNALLSENLHEEYPKLSKLEIAVFPSPTMASAVVEPYNAVLETHATLENTDCVFLVDNEAMYNICHHRLDIDSPTYTHLNGLLAQTVSSITASLRFKGTLNADFTDFQTNLVPYPRIHFPVMSYAPIVAANKVSHETLSVPDLTLQAFDPSNRLAKCQNEAARYIACCLLYRGDVAPKDVNVAIYSLKNKKAISFVPWSPTGFKVGINSRTPRTPESSDLAALQRAVCMICNTTAIKDSWMSLNSKFSVMAEKRAFFHWYIGEGIQEEDFLLAQEDILTLEEDYTQLDSE